MQAVKPLPRAQRGGMPRCTRPATPPKRSVPISTTADVPTVRQSRRVWRPIAGQPGSDGAGVKLPRVLTQNLHRVPFGSEIDCNMFVRYIAANSPATVTSALGPTGMCRLTSP